MTAAPITFSDLDRVRYGSQLRRVEVGTFSTSPQAIPGTTPSPTSPGLVDTSSGGNDHTTCDTHSTRVAPPDLIPWIRLRTAVEIQEAAMEYRKAFDNRIRSGNLGHPDPALLATLHEHELTTKLTARRVYRQCVPAPIRAAQRDTRGLGEQGVARLLGHTGPPAWKWVHRWEGTGDTRRLVLVESSPRTFGQLIAFAGLVPGAGKRSKGMTPEQIAGYGNPRIGPVLHSLADAAMKVGKPGDPLRDTYDEAKARYTTDHPEWGPGPGHWHNAALRIVKREILRVLWTASIQGDQT